MIITVASGKGGTGKTTVAVNLAMQITRSQYREKSPNTWLLDCDVEAPNAALFLHPQIDTQRDVTRLLPVIDAEKCDGCGHCTQVCSFNALAVVNRQAIFFRELCHACGSCTLNCPTGAISERKERIGNLQRGRSHNLHFAQGDLSVGFSSPVPVIRDLKKWVISTKNDQIVILDASPGNSCPVVEALRGSDFALLVTEPTPFGRHDLELVLLLVLYGLRMPCGVVINKTSGDDSIIEEVCQKHNVPILMRLPLSRSIAESYSRGELLIDAYPEYADRFSECIERIFQMEQGGIR